MIAELLATSQYGNVPEWIGIVIGAAFAWRITKGGGGSAVSELSKANRVLEKRMHDLGDEVRDLKIENARLKQRTDFAAVIAQHEERAQSRADGLLRVLDLIATRLGPEHGADAPNGEE